jgi:hypothetical protein
MKKERDNILFGLRLHLEYYLKRIRSICFVGVVVSLLFCKFCYSQKNKEDFINFDRICISGIHLGDKAMVIYKLNGKPDSVISNYSKVIPSDSSRYIYYSKSYFEVFIMRFKLFHVKTIV